MYRSHMMECSSLLPPIAHRTAHSPPFCILSGVRVSADMMFIHTFVKTSWIIIILSEVNFIYMMLLLSYILMKTPIPFLMLVFPQQYCIVYIPSSIGPIHIMKRINLELCIFLRKA